MPNHPRRVRHHTRITGYATREQPGVRSDLRGHERGPSARHRTGPDRPLRIPVSISKGRRHRLAAATPPVRPNLVYITFTASEDSHANRKMTPMARRGASRATAAAGERLPPHQHILDRAPPEPSSASQSAVPVRRDSIQQPAATSDRQAKRPFHTLASNPTISPSAQPGSLRHTLRSIHRAVCCRYRSV